MKYQVLEKYLSMILRFRWATLILSTIVMVCLVSGVRYVTISNDYRIMFSEENPQLVDYEALENTFTSSNRALIAVAPKNENVFTLETLAAIEEITEESWQLPYSSRVDSLTNYFYSYALEDDLLVEQLVDDVLSLEEGDVEDLRAFTLNEIEIAGRLVSHDGKVAGIAVNFILSENPDIEVAEIAEHIQVMLETARTNYPDIDFYLTGDTILSYSLGVATLDDFTKLMPIMIIVIVSVTMLLLRSVLCTVAIITVCIFVTNSTIGMVGWLGSVLSPTNSGIPLIITILSAAASIHVVSAVQLGMKQGLDRKTAVTNSVRTNVMPVFITSMTTAIGFLSLNASDSPPFHVLGNFVAFGTLCIFVYSMTLLPALLMVLPLQAPYIRKDRRDYMDWIAGLVIEKRTVILWSISLLTIALCLGIPRLELSDNWTKYFDESYEFRIHTDFINENLTGTDSLEYSLDSGSDGGITNPDYLQVVEEFASWFRSQPEVLHVQAFPDIMKRLNKNMHADNTDFYRLPEDQELAAQYLLLYEFSLPFGRDLNDRIDISKSTTRMTVVIRNLSSKQQRELDNRAQAWLDDNAPQLSEPATGFSILFAHISKRNIEGMLKGTGLALLLISFILIFIFRSIKLGLISLVPNFIPAFLTFGLWGYVSGRIGMAGSVMAAIALGIVVDDTVHFLTKYQKAISEGMPSPEAVSHTFQTVGRALWTTSLVLAAGFATFAFSGFEVSWVLGTLVSITIIFALITDFFLLPPLLMLIERSKL